MRAISWCYCFARYSTRKKSAPVFVCVKIGSDLLSIHLASLTFKPVLKGRYEFVNEYLGVKTITRQQ